MAAVRENAAELRLFPSAEDDEDYKVQYDTMGVPEN